jgi:hypothetical protein
MVMAKVVMAKVVMAKVVMAKVVMAKVVMAKDMLMLSEGHEYPDRGGRQKGRRLVIWRFAANRI